MTYFSERYGGTYVSLAEASERTGFSRDFLLASIKRGDIRAVEVGSSLFLDSSSLNALTPRQRQEAPKAEHIPRPAAARKKNQKNSLERFVEGIEGAQVSTGPGRFVFEREDALATLPILAISLIALFLAFPAPDDNFSAPSATPPFFFTGEVAESTGQALGNALVQSGSAQTAAASEVGVLTDGGFADVPREGTALANVLSASAEALQSLAHFIYETLGLTE